MTKKGKYKLQCGSQAHTHTLIPGTKSHAYYYRVCDRGHRTARLCSTTQGTARHGTEQRRPADLLAAEKS